MWRLGGAVLLLVSLVSLLAAADELTIEIGNRTREINSRQDNGERLYALRDLVQILGLSFEEQGNQLSLIGDRGSLQLTDGRRLVGFADQFILVSSAPWKRKEREWFVPEDLLTKALPHILSSRLERVADRRYRLETLESNRVDVRITNYPDHVTIVFVPSRQAPVEVQELSEYIRVEFREFLVQPQLPQDRADPRLVSGIEFNSRDVFGSFRIRKGAAYHSFRQFNLGNPPRVVVDIYAPPVTAGPAAPPDMPPAAVEPGPAVEPAVPDQPLLPAVPSRPRYTVTLDAGHGGSDLGVQDQSVNESQLSMALVTLIGQRLRQSGHSTGQTRNRDVALSLERRSALANYNQSRAFVSIHLGGSPLSRTNGPVVYIHQQAGRSQAGEPSQLTAWDDGQARSLARSRELGRAIQAELNSLFQTKNEMVEAPIALLAPVAAPAVMVEVGFLTNEGDLQKLTSVDFQQSLADAIARAVSGFLQ